MISIVIPVQDSAHVALMLLEETVAGTYMLNVSFVQFLKEMLDIDFPCLVLSESK